MELAEKKLQVTITGGQNDTSVQYVRDVQNCSNYLTKLSEELTDMKDYVNATLTELVDKEKTMCTSQRSQEDLEDMSESGMCMHVFKSRYHTFPSLDDDLSTSNCKRPKS